jgi:NitT/TauT family transport system substrate-binding protein
MSQAKQPFSKPRHARGLVLLPALALLLSRPWAGLGGEAEPGLTKVVFLPHWIPQAQFAGYYMALDQGFYRKHGLDVVLLDGGPSKPVDKLLVSGEATFASHFLSAALKLREEGIPVVHLAQVTQRSALLLVARKSRGIQSVRDLDGKKVSVWPDFAAQPNALFRKYNLHVQTITQGSTINPFMRGAVDAASAMWYNEYHLFLNSGLNEDEMTVFFYDRYDLNFPEDCILCLETTWRAKPAVCRNFVEATLEGWQYTLSHREEALGGVMRRAEQAHTGSNLAHQRWMLDRMCELVQPLKPEIALGELSRQSYEQVARELKNCGQLRAAPNFEEFHVGLHP